MSRIYFDSSKYHEAKARLLKKDGLHCVICGKDFNKPDKRKSYCSQECFMLWYDSVVKSWAKICDEVLRRDGKCMKCGYVLGAKRDHYEVHHIKPVSEGEAEFDPDNCVTLCYTCHREMHSHFGNIKRHNKSLEDFRMEAEEK